MLLIALVALLVAWGAVMLIVLGLCVGAARSDRELVRHTHLAPVARRRRFLRPIAG